jgi:hypothetical protein
VEDYNGQKLKRITRADRRNILLTSSANKRRRRWEEMRQEAKKGPGACAKCGAPSCGNLWPDARCCYECTHEEMVEWKPTHVLWFRGKPFKVMEETFGAQKTVSVYYRQDGLVQWIRRGTAHFFLGERVSAPEFTRFLARDAMKSKGRRGRSVTPDEIIDAESAEASEVGDEVDGDDFEEDGLEEDDESEDEDDEEEEEDDDAEA